MCATHPMCCHQDGEGRWNKFGGRLPWGPEAICSNNAVFGGKGSQKQGEDYTAAPNIDHSQQRVKDDIKAWMKWLRSSIGFDGWRFDFVKGYRAPHAVLVQPDQWHAWHLHGTVELLCHNITIARHVRELSWSAARISAAAVGVVACCASYNNLKAHNKPTAYP